MRTDDAGYLALLVGSWLVCYGLFSFVFLREAFTLGSGKASFYITDMWAAMLGWLPSIWLASYFLRDGRTDIFRWLFLAGMALSQLVGMIWTRMVAAPRHASNPRRFKKALLVVIGAIGGAMLHWGVYVATVVFSVFPLGALVFVFLAYLVVNNSQRIR